jgi:hypothetical protein
MRSVKTVRRTFPKAGGAAEEFAVEKQVSATDMSLRDSRKPYAAPQVSSIAPKSQASEETMISGSEVAAQRRKADTSMDMFRNMAKQIRK